MDFRLSPLREAARSGESPPPQAVGPGADSGEPAIVQREPGGFARTINVSVNAVESWEQGVRRPREATLKLLTIAHKHPEVLLARSDRFLGA